MLNCLYPNCFLKTFALNFKYFGIKTKDKILIGKKAVLDALKSGTDIEKVWLDKSIRGEFEKELRALTKEAGVPMQYVPDKRLTALASNTHHQGVAAQVALVQYKDIDDILPFVFESGKAPGILVLDGVEDVRNVGAIARSALWFDMDAIVVPAKNSARINSFALKASMGALLDIPVCRVQSLIKTLEQMRASGLRVICADSQYKKTPSEMGFTEPFALVMGSENVGINRKIIDLADDGVAIPGSGKVESLNVSVASAIIMHEIFRQRKSS